MERELNIIIHQMYQEKPQVKKRKGHFKKSRLMKMGRDGNRISLPSGEWRGNCVCQGVHPANLEVLSGRVSFSLLFSFRI